MILLPDWLFWSTLLFLIVESWTGLQRLMEARRLLLNS
jgi:archaetidylinositol phosphate synthase